MNPSGTELRSHPRIVPPDLLLQFGYQPNAGIQYDSAAGILGFSQGGADRVDLRSFGLNTRDGEGFVVGHTAQITVGGNDPEFQMLGTGTPDTRALLARFSDDSTAPALIAAKSRGASITDGTAGIVQDGDTVLEIRAIADDGTDLNSQVGKILFEVDGPPGANDTPGRIELHTTADGATSATERLRLDSAGGVFINETANANMSVGLTVNQGANDDEILAFKSSDVAHGLVTAGLDAETDTFLSIRKARAANGGVNINAFHEDAAGDDVFTVNSYGGTATTGKSTSANGLMTFRFYEHDGANGLSNIAANGNLFVIKAQVGGSNLARFLVDEDGDLYAVNTTVQAITDTYEDAHLIRAVERSRYEMGAKGYVHSKWDEFVRYNRRTLVEVGVLGDESDDALVNVTQLQRVQNGAIWQQHVAHMSLVEQVDSLASELTEAKQKLAALTA